MVHRVGCSGVTGMLGVTGARGGQGAQGLRVGAQGTRDAQGPGKSLGAALDPFCPTQHVVVGRIQPDSKHTGRPIS